MTYDLPASEWSPIYRTTDDLDLNAKPIRPAPVIKHYDGIDGTPIVAMAFKARIEQIEAGATPEVALYWSYQGIGAFVDGELVGCIVWHEAKSSHRLWLLQGYVDPAWRGRGIYSHLWKALVAKVRELKQPTIGSGSRFDNHAMRAIAKAQGRRETGVTFEYEVPAV